MESVTASIYDYPRYYDLVFGSDWAAEYQFIEAAVREHVDWPAGSAPEMSRWRLWEPACGTGRLLYRFARAGADVSGCDLNPAAVDYCNQRLKRAGLAARAVVADMCDFAVDQPYDAAFNTINSFRHLGSEEAATAHLAAMGRAIRPGGIYLLGLHLTPRVGPQTDEESWSARRGNLVVNTQMWPKDKDRRRRMESYHIRFDIYQPSGAMQIHDVLELRSYTAQQFAKLVEAEGSWRIETAYDFRYSLDDPIEVDERTEDVVYVLKRGG